MILLVIVLFVKRTMVSPEDAMDRFLNDYSLAEDQIMDPLILAGKGVVPKIIKAVSDKNMNRRRYAISFLGYSRDRKALPLLKKIVSDRKEEVYFRQDSLLAIYKIEESEAKSLAKQFMNDEIISRFSSLILADQATLDGDRTYFEALMGIHH